jgi:hypothetical protein
MKRSITIFALIAVLALPAGALAQAPYAWTISASTASPFVNTAQPTGTLATYYLWLACTDLPPGYEDGMASAEFDIVTSPPNSHIATVMINPPFLNAGGTANLLIAAGGCPGGPIVAANLLVLSVAPGTMDFAPSAANGNKVTVDCSLDPQTWPMDWVGLGIGTEPNGKGSADCGPVSVEKNSWGAVKGLYR